MNGQSLLGLNHVEVVTILKELPQHVRIIIARKKPSPLPAQPDFLTSSYAAVSSASRPVQLDTAPTAGAAGEPYSITLPSSVTSSQEVYSPQQAASLVKAKSDQALHISNAALASSLNKMKSRSLEPLTSLAMWSSEPEEIELHKGERGLGFSILDYQVCTLAMNVFLRCYRLYISINMCK